MRPSGFIARTDLELRVFPAKFIWMKRVIRLGTLCALPVSTQAENVRDDFSRFSCLPLLFHPESNLYVRLGFLIRIVFGVFAQTLYRNALCR
jgi:hypothetical protein